jgi:hypothetical protein
MAPKTPQQRFAALSATLAKRPGVTVGEGKGFGSSALKVNGKIFAMVSSKNRFVVKLPTARVAALTVSGEGRPFEAGRGRPMKEWLELRETSKLRWSQLAQEAYDFLAGA